MNSSILLTLLLVSLATVSPAHAVTIKLRKGVVDLRIRKIHHANKTNLYSQQLGEDGEKVDIINFMDAQVLHYSCSHQTHSIFFSNQSSFAPSLHLLLLLHKPLHFSFSSLFSLHIKYIFSFLFLLTNLSNNNNSKLRNAVLRRNWPRHSSPKIPRRL